jgi:HJR/Mrr/RecB family endonuclease
VHGRTSIAGLSQPAPNSLQFIHMDDLKPIFQLSPWQREFIDKYIDELPSKALLIAQAGMGKTAMSTQLAREMLSQELIDSVIVVSINQLVLHWQTSFDQHDIKLSSMGSTEIRHGLALTHADLRNIASNTAAVSRLLNARSLVIVDESDFRSPGIRELEKLIQDNSETRFLFLARHKPKEFSFDSTFTATTELYSLNELVSNESLLKRIEGRSPSFPLIQSINQKILTLDSLSWREFERLVAEILERDGYRVELMQGTKDGGVDVIGYKDLGLSGAFKVLMQAKKYSLHRKVGLSLVRELADTVSEHNASKGVLITTSYLTAGALDRIQLHQYKLGKVDRDDLSSIILRSTH